MRALIILPKTSRYSPSKVGDFRWNDEHQAHLWGGRALELEEFNTISKRIFYDRREEIANFDLPPYVQLVEDEQCSDVGVQCSAKADLKTEPLKTENSPKILKRKKAPLVPIPDLLAT